MLGHTENFVLIKQVGEKEINARPYHALYVFFTMILINSIKWVHKS